MVRVATSSAAFLVALLAACASPSVTAPSSWPDPPGVESLQQQLTASEAANGTDQLDQAPILLELGDAYRNAGGYVPAAAYVERALSIEEKTSGPESVEAGATLDKLGTLYLAQGDTARARIAFLRAKPILLKELGPTHPLYGMFLIHLAELQLVIGEKTEAQQTLEQALAACGDELSHADPQWTESNRRLGLLFLGLGRYPEAEQELVYAVSVRSEAPDPLYMAPVENSLGEYFVTVGRDDEAEPPLLDALAAYDKSYGVDHPLSEGVLVNLAALYEGKADASRARGYAERARALHRRSAGYSHVSDWPLRTIVRVAPPQRPPETPPAPAQQPVLLRLDAPVGRVAQYRTETQSWLPGGSTDPRKPEMVMADLTTESITAVDGDVRTVSTVVLSSRLDVADVPLLFGGAKDVRKGMTTVRRIDSRGRVLSSQTTQEGQGMQGQGTAAPHAVSTFTLPEGPVRVGDTWTATETMPMGQGTAGRTATVQVTYRLERIGVSGGAPVAVISMNGPVTAWLFPAGADRHLEPSRWPASGTLSGEIQLDLAAQWIIGLTMSMEDGFGTDRGLKTLMTSRAR